MPSVSPKVVQVSTITRDAVIRAALEWWRGRCPCSWTEEAHLENPKVNTPSLWEKELAVAVAAYIRETTP